MTPGPAVRVAVIGLGWAARSIWLPRLLDHPGYVVTVVADPDPDARRNAPADAAVRAVASVDDIGPGEADLAVVAVPNHLHATIAAQVLRAGINAFVEKPVCLTAAEADQLAAAERESAAMLLAGSAARYRADTRALSRVVGELGDLRHADISWKRSRGIPRPGGWFTDRHRSGGGALVDLGWHLLDVVSPLLGDAGFAQVIGVTSDDFIAAGTGGAAWREDTGGKTGDVEDTARGFLVTTSGVSVALQASWASHEPLDVTRIRIEGTRGIADLICTFGFSPNRRGGSVLTVTRHGQTETVEVLDEPIGTEYRGQLDEIRRLLADPGAKGRAVAETSRTIRLIERFYESARDAAAGPRLAPASTG